MKVAVVLENTGGELDRSEFSVDAAAEDCDEQIDSKAADAIESWLLSVGDTIRIIELPS